MVLNDNASLFRDAPTWIEFLSLCFTLVFSLAIATIRSWRIIKVKQLDNSIRLEEIKHQRHIHAAECRMKTKLVKLNGIVDKKEQSDN